MEKRIFALSMLIAMLFPVYLISQNKTYEVGVELQAASFSNLGGSIGGAAKFAIVEDETVAYGPSFRYQYFYVNNNFTGISANGSTVGGGGFLHYRFLDWFYAGTEIEVLQNPFVTINPDKRWTVTGFLGGGISRQWGKVRLNLGVLYDVVDALKDPLTSNPSPLRNDYFIRVQNPVNAQTQGAYLPIIYRVTFFFPLGINKD